MSVQTGDRRRGCWKIPECGVSILIGVRVVVGPLPFFEGSKLPVSSPSRTRLSIFQMMKLVIFFAVASASIAPMVHLWEAGVVGGGGLTGLLTVAIFGAVLVPLEWIGLSLLLIPRGSWRDTLIASLLLCSVLVALATACWIFMYQLVPVFRRTAARWDVVIAVLITSTVIIVLGTATVFLARMLLRVIDRRSSPRNF
jgi:hypothetical protein